MTIFRLVVVSAVALALAACSNTGSSVAVTSYAPEASPVAATTVALQATEIAQYIDPKALAILSDKEKAEAASAQFYALQFGRPGAPRLWQGDSGDSGRISVGPYVRVNDRDCREFTHEVSTGSGQFRREGLACRREGGTWTVAG